MNITEQIIEFINRRFPIDKPCDWMEENCYYFARILKMRFKGEIWYDLVEGHFLFRSYDNFYDWTGLRYEYQFDKPETMENLVKWSDYKTIDPVHYARIVRDVID